MFILFNESKKFIGYSNFLPPHIKFFKSIENFDPAKQIWRGGYDSGEIVDLNLNLNRSIDKELIKNIKDLYASEISHFLTIRQIGIIAEKLNCFEENFKMMYDEISPMFDKYDEEIEKLNEKL